MLRPTQLEQILEVLEANQEGLCDTCVRRITGFMHQAVNANCRRAKDLGLLTRKRSRCPSCKRVREVNHLLTITPTIPTTPKSSAQAGYISSGTPDWFERLRRQLVQKLNEIDGSSRGDSFSKRVTKLRNERRLPANIASMMLTFTSFRNLVCFERHLLTDKEKQIVHLASEELEEWLKKN